MTAQTQKDEIRYVHWLAQDRVLSGQVYNFPIFLQAVNLTARFSDSRAIPFCIQSFFVEYKFRSTSNLADNVQLDFCLGVYCFDCLGGTRQTVYTCNQDIIYPTVLQIIKYGRPEPCTFILSPTYIFRTYFLPSYQSLLLCIQPSLQCCIHYAHGNGLHPGTPQRIPRPEGIPDVPLRQRLSCL